MTAVEGKRKETKKKKHGGPRGCPPKRCRKKNTKSLERYKQKVLQFKEKQKNCTKKKQQKQGSKGVSS